MKVNKFELAPFKRISVGARGDVTAWLKLNRSFVVYKDIEMLMIFI